MNGNDPGNIGEQRMKNIEARTNNAVTIRETEQRKKQDDLIVFSEKVEAKKEKPAHEYATGKHQVERECVFPFFNQ